jgi:hypothetical protein
MNDCGLGQHSEVGYGVWEYASTDILPEAIVIEFYNSGLACGPVTDLYIHLCADITDVAGKCKILLNDLIECDSIDFGSYIDYALSEYLKNKPELADDQDKIIENWTQFQTERLVKLRDESKNIIDLKTLRKLKEIVEDYHLCDEVKCIIMEDWVKNSQEFLLSCLIKYDEKGNEILPSQKELIFKRNKKLIAKAINYYNIESKQ